MARVVPFMFLGVILFAICLFIGKIHTLMWADLPHARSHRHHGGGGWHDNSHSHSHSRPSQHRGGFDPTSSSSSETAQQQMHHSQQQQQQQQQQQPGDDAVGPMDHHEGTAMAEHAAVEELNHDSIFDDEEEPAEPPSILGQTLDTLGEFEQSVEHTFEQLAHAAVGEHDDNDSDSDSEEDNDGDDAKPSSEENDVASSDQSQNYEETAPSSSERGGASCDGTDLSCGPRGSCDVNSKICFCAALYTGSDCSVPRTAPAVVDTTTDTTKGPYLQPLGYAESITMTRPAFAKLKEVRVTLHGKEDDKDGGNRTLGKVTKDLLAVLPNADAMLDRITSPDASRVVHSCAVVGSSGSVLHFANGKDIDKHDLVFRFNSAPTKRFEKFVGARTTHRITNTQNWAYRESDDEQILVHMRSQASLRALQRTVSIDRAIKMAAFSTSFVEWVGLAINGFMATSGLYGILVAAQVCEHIDLYGFQVSTAHGVCAYHYYDSCDQPANAQRDDIEWFVVRELVAMGAARFMEPCIEECHEGEGSCEACKAAANFPKAVIRRRARCPPCSTAYGGCRPGQGGRPIQHWAFTRRGTPPPQPQWRSLPIWQRPGGYTLQRILMSNASALSDPALANFLGGRMARRLRPRPVHHSTTDMPSDVAAAISSVSADGGAGIVGGESGPSQVASRRAKRAAAALALPALAEIPGATVSRGSNAETMPRRPKRRTQPDTAHAANEISTEPSSSAEVGDVSDHHDGPEHSSSHRGGPHHHNDHEPKIVYSNNPNLANEQHGQTALTRLVGMDEHRKGHGRNHRPYYHHGRHG